MVGSQFSIPAPPAGCPMTDFSRRTLLVAAPAILLGGCVQTRQQAGTPTPVASAPLPETLFSADYASMYGPVNDKFPIAAVDLSRIEPAFYRRRVDYRTSEAPGTVVVDPEARYLYLVESGGRAMRYGVGVGRDGFAWAGPATINSKQEWPDWYPPKEMIERQPEIKKQVGQLQSGLGVPGGLRNPLGARALYLWHNGRDTLYRIHGTLEPWTIGKRVSSGCIRLINQDAIDLYNRVNVGAKVVVLGSRGAQDVATMPPSPSLAPAPRRATRS